MGEGRKNIKERKQNQAQVKQNQNVASIYIIVYISNHDKLVIYQRHKYIAKDGKFYAKNRNHIPFACCSNIKWKNQQRSSKPFVNWRLANLLYAMNKKA